MKEALISSFITLILYVIANLVLQTWNNLNMGRALNKDYPLWLGILCFIPFVSGAVSAVLILIFLFSL
jgi:hypothetical protein